MPETRVLICGDRNWNDPAIIDTVLDGLYLRALDRGNTLVVIEGRARGADTYAGKWADHRPGVKRDPYPAKWDEHHKAAGPIRNRQMLNEGKPHVVIAFHDFLPNSKGTKDMVEIAKAAGVPTYVVSRA